MDQTNMEPSYPVKVIIPQQEKYSRGLALATLLFFIPKAVMLIPHIFVLYFLSVAAFVVFIVAQFAVLFTGKYPKSLFDFISGTVRWKTRITTYFYGLSDMYPPFELHD